MSHDHPEMPRTGIAEIDGEHALELRVVRELQAALLAGERALAAELLERLADFTNAHFLTEQLLMRLHAYPGYEAHQQEHDRLIGELGELRTALADASPLDARGEADKLERWLLAHMATSDQALGDYLGRLPAGHPTPEA